MEHSSFVLRSCEGAWSARPRTAPPHQFYPPTSLLNTRICTALVTTTSSLSASVGERHFNRGAAATPQRNSKVCIRSGEAVVAVFPPHQLLLLSVHIHRPRHELGLERNSPRPSSLYVRHEGGCSRHCCAARPRPNISHGLPPPCAPHTRHARLSSSCRAPTHRHRPV